MRYQLNDKEVVSEVLDGEVIAIHLQSGIYYSMQESGAHIWNALLGGWSTEEIATQLVQDPELERERIGADIAHFVATLLAESLIVPKDGEPGARPDAPLSHGAYATPELHKYTDMQELLLVDPIHEVTEEGWPIRAEPEK